MKHFDIMTLGVPILEFTRMELDKPFSQAGLFYGPVPAGDPGIAMNACVRLGYTGTYVGATGEDAFADCFFAQMEASGIDVAYLRRDSSHDTALSMLTQFSDGSRDFVFTVPHSAAATCCEDDVCEELLKNVSWIHLSGFALSIGESSARAHHKVIALAPQETRISFALNFHPRSSTAIPTSDAPCRCWSGVIAFCPAAAKRRFSPGPAKAKKRFASGYRITRLSLSRTAAMAAMYFTGASSGTCPATG